MDRTRIGKESSDLETPAWVQVGVGALGRSAWGLHWAPFGDRTFPFGASTTMRVPSIAILALLGLSPSLAAQGNVSSFCMSGTSGASISATGSTDPTAMQGAGDLVLRAEGLPQGSLGIFLQGNLTQAAMPFGGGFLCIGGNPKIWRHGPVTTGPTGTSLSFPLDMSMPVHPAAQITPGSTWNFQAWFRVGGGADLTDAIEVRFDRPSSIGVGTELVQSNGSKHPLGTTPQGGALLISSAPELQAFWDLHMAGVTGAPPPPVVDWSQDVVVAVFAGLRLTSGYSIEITDLSLGATDLHVTTVETKPGPGCGVFFKHSQPFQLVTTPAISFLDLRSWTPLEFIKVCP